MRCQSCQLVRINGVVCHETGCPDAWRTQVRECAECGTPFRPEGRAQRCCDEQCERAFAGLSDGFDGAFALDEADGLADWPGDE